MQEIALDIWSLQQVLYHLRVSLEVSPLYTQGNPCLVHPPVECVQYLVGREDKLSRPVQQYCISQYVLTLAPQGY